MSHQNCEKSKKKKLPVPVHPLLYADFTFTHVIYRARAPRMVSRPAEGGCFCLATVSVFSLMSGVWRRPSASDCHRLLSRARKHAATSPLSRVTAAAFLLASEYATSSSPAGDHACICVCFIIFMLPHTVYRVRREPSPSLAPLQSTYCESKL